MKINVMKIVVRGLELLNVELKSVLSRSGTHREYYGDMTASVGWKQVEHGTNVFTFSPFIWELSFEWRKRSVMVCFELSIEILKGLASVGMHMNVMQDDYRKMFNKI